MERKANLLVLVTFSFCAAAAVAGVELLNTECTPVQLDVQYPASQGNCGGLISISLTAQRPTVKFVSAVEDAYYTLMMVDPDAPFPENPSFRYWLHWLVTDIKGSDLRRSSTFGGFDVAGYAPPNPPRGTHRYYFYLYQQSRSPLSVLPITERARFDPGAFASLNDLGHPVAMYMFKANSD